MKIKHAVNNAAAFKAGKTVGLFTCPAFPSDFRLSLLMAGIVYTRRERRETVKVADRPQATSLGQRLSAQIHWESVQDYSGRKRAKKRTSHARPKPGIE
jgi:hypothetical protein